MLAANVAKMILAKLNNNSAKPLFIQMGTTLALTEPEMRLTLLRDTCTDTLCISPSACGVFLRSLAVNINLPTDTTAMPTPICDARKILIIFRCKKLHCLSFSFGIMRYAVLWQPVNAKRENTADNCFALSFNF
jgi:hypothetical protein